MKKNYGNIKLADQNDFQKDKVTNLTARFNRWHDKQINLLTFLINLFFTLSIATIGFIVNNFKNDLFDQTICNSISIGKTISIILIISVFTGVLALFFRFYDFRYTKEKIKFRKLKFRIKENLKYEASKEWTEYSCQDEIDKYDKRVETLGKLTLIFFYVQVSTYLISLTSIIWSI